MWPSDPTQAGAASPPPGGPQGAPEGNSGDNASRPRVLGSRFTFPSGSRPLDGYTIKRGVGIGGFGEVYFAVSDAGKEVALKRIQRNLDIELRGVRQCLNLKHQNLVALFDIRYDEQEQAWVVMEFVSGASLKDVIEQSPNGLPIEEVNRWFRGLAAGTSYLHDHGIVHRDLKPGNVFDDDGIVKIGDYGLSKFISCSRRSGQTESVGTFHYMAPEIGRGNYGREIDIYALGIILYEMLTGNVPFDGESTQEIIMKHLTAEPDVSMLPQPYRYVVHRALLKDPQKRFSAVYEMVDALGLASPSEQGPIIRNAPRVQAEIETPPIAFASPLSVAAVNSDPLYITDDAEMVFGPVKVATVVVDDHAPTATPQLAAALGDAPSTANDDFGAGFWKTLDLENEPIAAAVMRGSRSLRRWWCTAPIGAAGRIFVIVGVAAGLSSVVFAVPAVLLLVVGYVLYLGIRFATNYAAAPAQPAPPALSAYPGKPYTPAPSGGLFTPSNGAASAYDPAIPPIVISPPRSTHHAAHSTVRPQAAAKPAAAQRPPEAVRRERLAMLFTSMFVCAILAASLSTSLVFVLRGKQGFTGTTTYFMALATWLGTVNLISCWAILLTNWFFLPTKGPSVLYRLAMAASGALVACAALALLRFLEIDALPGMARLPRHNLAVPQVYSTVAFFVVMFLSLGWWKQCDALRSPRWNVGATIGVMVVASLLGFVFQFPQPWPAAIAGVVSLSLQWGSARFSGLRRTESGPYAISA